MYHQNSYYMTPRNACDLAHNLPYIMFYVTAENAQSN